MTTPLPPRRGAHRAGRRDLDWYPDDPEPAPEQPHWPDRPYPRASRWRRTLAGPVVRSVVMSGAAVVVVGAVIATVWAMTGGGDAPATLGDRAPSTGSPHRTGAASRATTAPPARSTRPVVPVPTTTPAAPAAPVTSATPPAASSHPATRPPTTAPTGQPVAPPARLPLLVLNDSRVTGLAARAAADFRAAGWPIAGTGNYAGRIVETTAYYEPGQERAARALAARFASITRVLPRFAGLPGHGLTVVVTRYYLH
ncbi:MAG: LytR C-terminal domain-containing protein [Frankiaceae bacterium]